MYKYIYIYTRFRNLTKNTALQCSELLTLRNMDFKLVNNWITTSAFTFLSIISQVTVAYLGKYFSQFGELVEAKLMLDDSKKSKRFGFVTFSNLASVTSVLNSGDFFMCGKQIVVGPAVKRMVRKQNRLFNYNNCLVWVGWVIHVKYIWIVITLFERGYRGKSCYRWE